VLPDGRERPAVAALVHLVGYPGAGKYTIATEFARLANDRGRRFVVVDNHHTSNVIFSVLPVDGVRPLPATVWDRVGEVRDALLRTIEELSPPDWSFVFTNVLSDGVAADEDVIERLRLLAASRHSHYVPVRLTCSTDELLRRVSRPERKARQKWVDTDGVRAFVESSEVITIAHPALLDLDVTQIPAHEAAALILDHIEGLPST
jgi:hypothetical protein